MNRFFIFIILIAGLFVSSCDHITNCKIPAPTFDLLTKNVDTSIYEQVILASKFDPNAKYTWSVVSTPLSNKKSFYPQAGTPTLNYTFDKNGIYKFSLASEKFDCKSDTVYLTVNATPNSGTGNNTPCVLPSGKNYKVLSNYYTSTNAPTLTVLSSYCYIGLYDNSGNTIYFYLPKTFKSTPTLGDYTINGSKTYSQLLGTECGIEIKGTRYAAINSSARVHIVAGTSKAIELSVCSMQYLYNGTVYTLEAKFEFNP